MYYTSIAEVTGVGQVSFYNLIDRTRAGAEVMLARVGEHYAEGGAMHSGKLKWSIQMVMRYGRRMSTLDGRTVTFADEHIESLIGKAA